MAIKTWMIDFLFVLFSPFISIRYYSIIEHQCQSQVKGFLQGEPEFCLTWSGFSPGGTQVYSSRAQPESSSEWANVCLVAPLATEVVVAPLGTLLLVWTLFEFGALFWATAAPPPLSMELLSWAAMAADVAAANGSEPVNPLKELLWSSLGHLQLLQTCLKKIILKLGNC